jgi:uncharacterized protein
MARLILLVLVVGVVVWWVFGRSRARASRPTEGPREAAPFAVCAHCGVHLPMHDAVLDGNTAYCSDVHRIAGPKDRGAP